MKVKEAYELPVIKVMCTNEGTGQKQHQEDKDERFCLSKTT